MIYFGVNLFVWIIKWKKIRKHFPMNFLWEGDFLPLNDGCIEVE